MIAVSDFMTKDLVTVRESDDLALAESLLRLSGIRHLPVVKEGRLVGLVTQRDVLRSGQSGRSGARTLAVSEIMTRDLTTVRAVHEPGASGIGRRLPYLNRSAAVLLGSHRILSVQEIRRRSSTKIPIHLDLPTSPP